MNKIVEGGASEKTVTCTYGFSECSYLSACILANTVFNGFHTVNKVLVDRCVRDVGYQPFYLLVLNLAVFKGNVNSGIGNVHGIA